jgi:UDPglucose--hexose-1-phosphate uridylyltransferase
MSDSLLAGVHRRRNPLTGEWILVSPQRNRRPWLGAIDSAQTERPPAFDATCYLCPGNTRANGERNPHYQSTYVFDNDFPALVDAMDRHAPTAHDDELFVARRESGRCRVVCFSPRHDLTLAELSADEMSAVVDTWTEEFAQLGTDPAINHVQIFENKGAIMGCSNPHPHGQIWAQSSLPLEAAREGETQHDYFARHRRTLLSDYVARELQINDRIVLANDSFVAVVPFWAIWPFEALVIARRAVANLTTLTDAERADFADVVRRLAIRYDNLFATSFPYSAGIHQAPTDGRAHPEWHLHMHFYPPLLRSATVRKFLVGYEMLGEPQRDLTPETAAERLRTLSDIRFSEQAR